MNTDVKFNCTEVGYGEIIRRDFHTILPSNISPDYHSVNDWLNSKIEIIYNDFNLELVLDWNISDYGYTQEDIKNIELVKSCPGKIIFEDDLNQRLLKLKAENYDIVKDLAHKKRIDFATLRLLNENKEETIPKRDYNSCWISPLGEITYLAFAEHNNWARHYLEKSNPELFDEYGRCFKNPWKDAYVVLEDMGWLRILGWNDPPCFVIPDNITPKQKQALREYCISEKVLYKDFPEILKS